MSAVQCATCEDTGLVLNFNSIENCEACDKGRNAEEADKTARHMKRLAAARKLIARHERKVVRARELIAKEDTK